MPYHIEVTEHDILHGQAGNCFYCAVALAIQRATSDKEAKVYERDWLLYLEVRSRSILAPGEVRQWIWVYDNVPRDESGKIDPTDRKAKLPEPFAFDLPDHDDPEWQEQCCHCECLFPPKELDDGGICPECLKKEEGE